jgi:hypothetical protein
LGYFSYSDLQEFWSDPNNSSSIEYIKRDLEENDSNENNHNNGCYHLLDIKYIELNSDYN